MTCDCIEKVDKELADKGTNTRLAVALGVKPGTLLMVGTVKADDKKRGKPVAVFATFCPFCSKRLNEPTTAEQLLSVVEEFNRAAPIGTKVRYYTMTRDDEPKEGRIKHEATLFGGHTPVAWIDTHTACVAITHVDIIGEES